MFSGIIKEVGKIKRIEKKTGLWKIEVISQFVFQEVDIADSVSVNGVCLTLVGKKDNVLFFDTVETTLKNTNLKRLRRNSLVNLEPPLRVGDKLSGHFVLGHVDCEARIKTIKKQKDFHDFEIETPLRFKKYIVEKGSIAVEGVSLTIQKIKPYSFIISIIPFTFHNTNLREKKIGSWVNLEFDYLLKTQLGG